jgi:hypothetical protein
MYLQENLTKITAKYLRETTTDMGFADDLLASNQRLYSNSKMRDLIVSKKIGINPFAGTYNSIITCTKCGPSEALFRLEVSYVLSLDLSPSLEDSLNLYFKGETINDFTCIKCSLRAFLSNYPRNPK